MSIVIGYLLLFFPLSGHPQVDAGPDVTINPGVPVTLTTSYGRIGYGITFANEAGVEGPFPIGFDYYFFDEGPYNKFWVGANGWISFIPNPNSSGIRDAFRVPSAATNIPKSCILGPFVDLYPIGSGAPYVFYRTVPDTVPGKMKLVVMWCQCPAYDCRDSVVTFQIILHESDKSIENQIFQKPECSSMGTRFATQGIQNQSGYLGFVVPGNSGIPIPPRNATVWSVPAAKPEGWLYSWTSPDTYDIDTVKYGFEPISPPDKISYSWYEGSSSEPFSHDTTVVVAPGETTVYTVKAVLCSGEEFSDQVMVTVNPRIPNAFSPNDDKVNDEFNILGIPAENITRYNIEIFNRWGQKVYSSGDIRQPWNGKMYGTGKTCPDGIYSWVIYYEDNAKAKVTNKGTVTLIR